MLSHIRYANVTATLALFVALGGTATAASRLLITGADVQNHSLSGADIKSHSVGTRVLNKAATRHLRGAKGARGRRGAHGLPGAPGTPGAAGPQGERGPAGTGITTATAAGVDQPNYVDLTPLATYTIPTPGDYVIFT